MTRQTEPLTDAQWDVRPGFHLPERVQAFRLHRLFKPGQVDRRLEDFLKIVQASDLSALSNTISEELVFFVRRVLT